MDAAITKWIGILHPLVADAVETAEDGPALLARALMGGESAAGAADDRRAEIATLYRYVAALMNDREAALDGLRRWVGTHPVEMAPAPADAPPEAWWYAQLVRLHGLNSLAVLSGDATARQQADALARFVHAEIQPDHATGLPWGLGGLILAGGDCEATAEWVLNACLIQAGGTPRGAALVLLAETLYVLRHVVPGR